MIQNRIDLLRHPSLNEVISNFVVDQYCGESVLQELILTSPRAGSRLSLLHEKFYFEIRLIDPAPCFRTHMNRVACKEPVKYFKV